MMLKNFGQMEQFVGNSPEKSAWHSPRRMTPMLLAR